MRVQHETRQADGIARLLVPHKLDAQIVHVPRRLQIHVLTLRHHRGHVHLGHAERVLGGVEIRFMRIVGELNLEGEVLRRLHPVELQVDVVHLGVQIGKLDHVVDFGDLILLVGRLLERERIAQIDGVVTERLVEVDVEHKHFKKQCNRNDHRRHLGDMHKQSAPRKNSRLVQIRYIPSNCWHGSSL